MQQIYVSCINPCVYGHNGALRVRWLIDGLATAHGAVPVTPILLAGDWLAKQIQHVRKDMLLPWIRWYRRSISTESLQGI